MNNGPLDRLYEDYWEYTLKEFPLLATYLGDHRYDDRLEDASREAYQKRVTRFKQFLDKLRSIGRPSGGKDSLNYDLFEREMKFEVEAAQFKPYLSPISQQTGPHIDIPQLVTYHPFRTVQDYDNYLNRLTQFPRLIDQLIDNMTLGIEEKIVPAKVVVEAILPQLQAHVVKQPEKSEFYKPFNHLPSNFSARNTQRLRKRIGEMILRGVVPSYEKLSRFVRDEYLPAARSEDGVWALPDGKERYAFHIRYYTTTDKAPDEIHELGQKELKRIHSEMRGVMKKAGFNGTVQEYATRLRNDKSMYYRTGRDLLTGFKEILHRVETKLPLLFGRLPKAKFDFREIEAYRAEAAPDAYYYRPPEDMSRPGYFYVNTHKPESRPKYTMEALAYHEAVPGHHLQIALQQELNMLPKFRRYGGYTAFVEGWALYSEYLPKEVGFYKELSSEFGRLTLEAWRAARLVVDTGMHHKQWTRQEAVAFMEANTALSRHNIISEVDRYIAWPGQALAYKLGQLKISELRGRVEKKLGPKFDLRQFHDELLNDGALALDVLEKKMDTWLEQATASR